MSNRDKPIRNPYVALREEFNDWAVLFDPDTGRRFNLSPTGIYVWKLLDGGIRQMIFSRRSAPIMIRYPKKHESK